MRAGLTVPALLAAAFLSACSHSRPALPGERAPQGPGAAAVFEKRTFALVKVPDPDLEMALESILSDSHAAAMRRYSGDSPLEIGFTYSMAPRGAVYPFSEIEVSCIMQQKYASRKGPELCSGFFSELDARIKKALAARQQVTP
ncbi:MAG: hypothetical protein M0025_12320 [Elusimicrobia bacterium]|nr:hypothetical protein [Elusimicrobiota bacterium]